MKAQRREALEEKILEVTKAGMEVMITIDLTVLVYLALWVLMA